MADPETMAEIEAARVAMAAQPEAGLDLLFRAAHTHNGWEDRALAPAFLQQIVDLAKMGPTLMNCQPLRAIFVTSAEAKARLAPAMSEGNRAKTLAAPATAILCWDRDFWQNMPELAPHMADPTAPFRDRPEQAATSGRMNGTLQAGYFLMAARALGLDCGPMGGFDKAAVAEAFLDGRNWEVSFLVNLGHGDPAKVRKRAPRLDFARMAAVV